VVTRGTVNLLTGDFEVMVLRVGPGGDVTVVRVIKSVTSKYVGAVSRLISDLMNEVMV
jgi:hypothetical protein